MTLTAEYFLFATIAAVSIIQIASVRGRLKGLTFSQTPRTNRIISVVLGLPAAVAFFTWNFRNPVGIVEGAQQAGLFSLSVLSAVAITVIISSVLNHRRLSPIRSTNWCIDSLREMTFYQAFMARYFWKS